MSDFILSITQRSILNLGLAIFTVMVLLSFLWAQRKGGKYENFDLLKLITNKFGEPDRPAIMECGVFALMCWAFVVQVLMNKLAEWYVTIFVGAFVLRSAYSAWLRTKGDKDERDSQNFRDEKRLPPVSRHAPRGAPQPGKDTP